MKACRDCKHLASGQHDVDITYCRLHLWSEDLYVQWYESETVQQNREPVRPLGKNCSKYEGGES